MLALGRFRTGISSAEEVLGLHRGGGCGFGVLETAIGILGIVGEV